MDEDLPPPPFETDDFPVPDFSQSDSTLELPPPPDVLAPENDYLMPPPPDELDDDIDDLPPPFSSSPQYYELMAINEDEINGDAEEAQPQTKENGVVKSEESSDENEMDFTDADAAIDAMLDDLQLFQNVGILIVNIALNILV